jgi:hypothetical protein
VARLADSNKVSQDEATKVLHEQIQGDMGPWGGVIGVGIIRRLFEGSKNPHLKKV